MKRTLPILLPFALIAATSCAPMRSVTSAPAPRLYPAKTNPKAAVLARARVWEPTDVASADIKKGPDAKDGFAFGETITCTYVKREMAGKSPKFMCILGPDDEIKVKFGGTNGEVYGEVAATRLLWALGFGADRMYPVKVVCRDCPDNLNGTIRSEHERVFDPATVERKLPGASFHPDDTWAWQELDLVDEAAGGATRAQRDALKLLAVFLQHTDSKPPQQRLLCLNEAKPEGNAASECKQPLMMLNDVGLTFGRANTFNANSKGSANLSRWAPTPVWKAATGCVGNLPKSMTGTLNDPVISEQGRQFLADLMMQLSDAQIRDLFEVSRMQLRLRNPDEASSGFATIEEWVDAFKAKRAQIVDRRCSST